MVEESARVVRLDGEVVWVEAIRQSACGKCAAQKGCGHSMLAKLGQKRIEVAVQRNGHTLAVDDDVLIGVPDNVVLNSSLLLYGLPLLFMLLIAGLADSAGLGEGLTALAAMTGMLLGFWLVSRYSQRQVLGDFQPTVLRKLAAPQTIPMCEV